MKLIVHVGIGKTGSSSIQSALAESSEALAANKMKYLGLMLEHGLSPEKATWQRGSGSPEFFVQLEAEDAARQLEKVLATEVRLHAAAGTETLIWSNEWIGERAVRVIPALKLVESQGVEVEIILYVRRHDRMIVSAYMQWGIKHKTYPGPIRSFDDWIKTYRNSYRATLRRWLEAFDEKVAILNYDAVDDVAKHFLDRLEITAGIPERVNVSPGSDRLAAWAVFNNRFSGPVPMRRFETLLRRIDNNKENAADVPEPTELLPKPQDIEALREKYAEDLAYVNSILEKRGEPPLSLEGDIKTPKPPSSWEMDRFLLELVFHLQQRVQQLEKRLSERS